MNDLEVMGLQITKLRKARSYTQEDLGNLLHVTPQAVSKWELGQAAPEISLLPKLATIFEISLDQLLTGYSFVEKVSPYDTMYDKAEYYWGLQQSNLAEKAVQLLKKQNFNNLKLLELGSGEGRDAIYFAKCGLHVDALEISLPGIRKMQEYSQLAGTKIHTIERNMIGYHPQKKYHCIYSMGTLQFLPPQRREEHFTYYKTCTQKGGINAHLVFVYKPFLETAPDWQETEDFYWSGELSRYYHDWNILFQEEKILNCSSSGIAHRHAVCSIIAERVL